MTISRETVEHVARLAHIGLRPEEVDAMSEQLSSILDHIQMLHTIDTSEVAPTTHVVAMDSVMRDDTVSPSWPPEAVLHNAPHRSDDFFQVQAVFD